MKKKKVESLLRRELIKSTPDVWDRISSNEPQRARGAILAGTGANVEIEKGGTKKILIAAVAFVLALSLALGVALPLVLGGGGSESILFPPVGYLSVDINPGAQFVLDGEGKVSEVKALNEDARIILKNKESALTGLSAADALVKYVDLAAQAGYISVRKKNNAVLLSAALSDSESEDKFQKELSGTLKEHFKEKGVYAVVLTDIKDRDAQQKAEAYGISESKMRLIEQAIAIGAVIAESEYSSISVAEINERMSDRAEELEKYGSDELKERLEEAEERAEEKGEAAIEKLESLLELLEDSEEESAEEAIEAIEKAVETIGEAFENGRDLFDAFEKLGDLLSELTLTGESAQIIENLKTEANNISEQMREIEKELEEEKSRIAQLQQERYEKYAEEYEEYAKDDDFDDDYESWLESAESEYMQNWDALKESWRQELDD